MSHSRHRDADGIIRITGTYEDPAPHADEGLEMSGRWAAALLAVALCTPAAILIFQVRL